MNKLKELVNFIRLLSYPLSKDTKKVIEKNLRYMFTFEELKNRLTLSPKLFFFKPTYRFYFLCRKNIQNAADKILELCGLKNVSVRIIHERLTPSYALQCLGEYSTTVPGLTYSLSPSQFTIYIDKNYSSKVKGAVLSHEIGHIYTAAKNIHFKTKGEEKAKFSEQMTDLLTICLGLGELMLKGNSYHFVEEGVEYYGTLGYLKPKVLKYAQSYMKYMLASRS